MQLVANATDHTAQGLRCMTVRRYTVIQNKKKRPLSPAVLRVYVSDKVILFSTETASFTLLGKTRPDFKQNKQ